MVKITCKMVKQWIPEIAKYVYKGHNEITKRPEVRIDLNGLPDELIQRIRFRAWQNWLVIMQDNPKNLPNDFIVRWREI